MKKIFSAALLAFYLFLSFVAFQYCNIREEIAFSGGHHTLVYIEVNPDKRTQAIAKLSAFMKEHDVTIERRIENFKVRELSIYTTNPAAYQNRLESGRMPTPGTAEFVYTADLNDLNQSGKLKRFNLDYSIKIYDFSAYSLNPSAQYMVNKTDYGEVQALCQKLAEIDSGTLFQIDIHRIETINQDPLMAALNHFELIVLFFLLILSLWTYDLFRSAKVIMIRKLFGAGNLDIIRSEISKVLIRCILSCAASIVVLIAVLLFTNHLYIFSELLLAFWGLSGFFTGLIVIILLVILVVRIALSTSVSDLKNKRQLGWMAFLAAAGKMIAIFILFPVITTLPSLISTVAKHNAVQQQWEVLKNYAILPVYEEKSVTTEDLMALGDKYRDLYKLETVRGGILMRPSGNLATYFENASVLDPDEPFFLVNNTVTINNNYLQLNPIMDLNGNIIDLPDDSEESVTVLMPEKYAAYEDQFKKELIEEINFRYYAQIDFLLEEKSLPIPKREDRNIKLIYIEDNQFYFSCDPEFAEYRNFYFKDPI